MLLFKLKFLISMIDSRVKYPDGGHVPERFFVYLIQGLQGLAGLPGDEGGMGEPVCNAFIHELLQSSDVEFQFLFQFTTNLWWSCL